MLVHSEGRTAVVRFVLVLAAGTLAGKGVGQRICLEWFAGGMKAGYWTAGALLPAHLSDAVKTLSQADGDGGDGLGVLVDLLSGGDAADAVAVALVRALPGLRARLACSLERYGFGRGSTYGARERGQERATLLGTASLCSRVLLASPAVSLDPPPAAALAA